jgi:hypothetical protein
LRGCDGFAKEEVDDREEGDDLEDQEGCGHSAFLRPQDSTPGSGNSGNAVGIRRGWFWRIGI